MGLHKSIDFYTKIATDSRRGRANDSWQFLWPNTADFNFNYYKLLQNAEGSAIGHNNNPSIKIAIIGAGVAGITAARELFRCGYTNIDIYEASDRISGRTYSIPIEGQYTVFEMGAMRMPFFTAPDSGNCVLDYYRNLFQIKTQPFPNPGSDVADTGIYLNNGYGPDQQNPYPAPQLDIWLKGEHLPPTEQLQDVYQKWSHFADLVLQVCQDQYEQETWQDFWHNMVGYYWDKNFRELAYMPAIDRYDPAQPGFFGGLGMDETESALFYTIGAGDGSWGAFYDICSLYPIRTLLFGFGTNHQLIQGSFDNGGYFQPGPQYQQPTQDSLGNSLNPPSYLGVQTFAECLFYSPVNSRFVDNISLYTACQSASPYDINLYTQNSVNQVNKIGPSEIEVTSNRLTKTYNMVILTPPTWATQKSIEFSGFDSQTELPFNVIQSIKTSHWITSCKVFYRLKQRYWEVSNIPQLISTDTYLQGVYGYAVQTEAIDNDPGVLLVSYTWEDDANKLIAESNQEALAQKCLELLDNILLQCQNIQQPISPYVDTSQPAVIHWIKQPSYRGCAKLYRETTWNENYALLRYNQKFSASSGLYFAGEGFSVEGGWTEPALRSALDAIIHLVKNSDGTFLNGFDYANYPQYSDWDPWLAGHRPGY